MAVKERTGLKAAARGNVVRWAVSLAGAALMLVVAVVLFRAPAPRAPEPRVDRRTPPIKLVPGRADELVLRDLAPLFLPTAYNAEPEASQAPQPGRSFFDRDAVALKFDEHNPGVALPPLVRPPASAAEALSSGVGTLALGLGRVDGALPPPPPNGGHVDVYGENSTHSLLGLTLPPDARPKSGAGEALSWHPLEFLAAVDASGLVGPLVLTSGSGVEEVDNFFRNYLAETFRIADRLPPGFYRIAVGP